MEQTYLDAIKQLYTQQPTGLQTIQPAQQFYNDVLGGSVGVTGQPFQNAVYNSTAAGALQNYDLMRKNLAENFSQRGGYFGGANSLAQAQLANQTSNSLNQLLSGLNLTGFQNDVAARQAAASGLAGLGTTQQGISSQILNDIYGGGQLITQRDLLNRQQSQEAQGRAYQDYLNQQAQSQLPFQYAMQLLGYNATQPFALQNQQSPWGSILGSLLQAGGTAAAGALGAASSKKWKKDIEKLSEEDEKKIFAEIDKIPLYRYRYSYEPDSVKRHVGLIAEESPEEITLFERNMVGLYEYIGFTHAAIKVLKKKIEDLEAERRLRCQA
jgi:hypothetical protein